MSTVFLNGEYLPLEQARISPMDRGFLFGDGVYEVIPSFNGRLVGLMPHLRRLYSNLKAISLSLNYDDDTWRDITANLLAKNEGEHLGIYIQISRGADTTRFHGFPENVSPTVFAFTFPIAVPSTGGSDASVGLKVTSSHDLRWKRCNIKSTSLLGNVLHFQKGREAGVSETILFNDRHEVTEAAACNVFMVKNDVIATPPLDHQLLPGITRYMVLDILRRDGVFEVNERVITMDELRKADEIWLTSSSKGIAPVVELDHQPVGNGKPGDIWRVAQSLYCKHQFDF